MRLLFAFLALGVKADFQPLAVPFKAPVVVAPGFSAKVLFSNLTAPRGITFDSHGSLLVVERGFGITAFTKRWMGASGYCTKLQFYAGNPSRRYKSLRQYRR